MICYSRPSSSSSSRERVKRMSQAPLRIQRHNVNNGHPYIDGSRLFFFLCSNGGNLWKHVYRHPDVIHAIWTRKRRLEHALASTKREVEREREAEREGQIRRKRILPSPSSPAAIEWLFEDYSSDITWFGFRRSTLSSLIFNASATRTEYSDRWNDVSRALVRIACWSSVVQSDPYARTHFVATLLSDRRSSYR